MPKASCKACFLHAPSFTPLRTEGETMPLSARCPEGFSSLPAPTRTGTISITHTCVCVCVFRGHWHNCCTDFDRTFRKVTEGPC